jgi:hypothetical protein
MLAVICKIIFIYQSEFPCKPKVASHPINVKKILKYFIYYKYESIDWI